jgi:hypothetical protein
MPTNYKVLGQLAPSATTATTLFTVPSATEVIVSSLVVTNRGAVSGTYRIAVRPNGATLAAEHFIAFDVTLGANSFVSLTIGLTIDASDVITIQASTADFSFSAFGSTVA